MRTGNGGAAAKRRARIVLADDHVLFSEGLRGLLEPEYQVVATVRDGAELIRTARELQPDLVIADMSMPLCNGIDAIRAIRCTQPRTKAICLTMHTDRMYSAAAFEAGAAGFVVKHAATDELRDAVRAVLHGRSYVSLQVGGQGAVRSPSVAPELFELSVRQRQVLQLIAEGWTVRRIAQRLKVTPKTVEFHKYRIMERLGVKSSADLIRFAMHHGLAEPSPEGPAGET